jgi:hypothetical protein
VAAVPPSLRRALSGRLRVIFTVAAAAAAASALPALSSVGRTAPEAPARGSEVQHLHYRLGPLHIRPGQNTNTYALGGVAVPPVPGYILRFAPNMTYTGGKVPAVDVLHLHHAVWLVNRNPIWFAGEEKSAFELPPGYGWKSVPGDRWIVNHMIHNLYPKAADVYITWDIDFLPASAPEAKAIKPVQTIWLDARGGENYPVFDVRRGSGKNGRFTYPDQAPLAYTARDPRPYLGAPTRNTRVLATGGTLVAAVGHLHPGGLWNDFSLVRGGARAEIFRGSAHYFEPAGPVSWDVSLGATAFDWRVRVRAGDRLAIDTTYDTRASWYESMGLGTVYFASGDTSGSDPFTGKIDRTERLTHGHLAENDNHGGAPGAYPDVSALPAAAAPDILTRIASPGAIVISGFRFSRGDLTGSGAGLRPPSVLLGQRLSFVNADAGKDIFHTITACRLPCSGSTGIASPLADATFPFDSGELGFGPPGISAAANTASWSTPKGLPAGTYTYYCRIHPFMRGSFRVLPLRSPLG